MNRVAACCISSVAFSLLLHLAGCGSDSPNTPPPAGEDWTLGPVTVQDIDLAAGESIAEPVSGGVLVFPEGGQGELRLAEIVDGPEAPFPGVGVSIEYDGDEPVVLRLPDVGGEAVVMGWGASPGSFGGDDAETDRWISLLRDPDDAASFVLSPPFEPAAKRTNRQGYTKHHIANLPAGAADAVRLAAVRDQAASDIQSWLDALPDALWLDAASRVDLMPPTYYADDDYYIGFSRYRWGIYPGAMIGLRSSSSADGIAHEVGHYMHHILIGDALYLQMENNAPDVHGINDYHPGRPSIGEDVAYFSQFLLRGVVNNYDPTEPAELFHQRNPRTHDFPALEGLACCLLARLWSADPTIGALGDASNRLPVPVIGAGMSDVLGVIALGAPDIDGLLADVTTYLAGRGRESALPVLLERLGWTYMVRLRLVDQDGQPLRNVPVEKLAVDGLDAYHPWTTQATTDNDGYLEDNYFFPLDSLLRVTHLGREFDVPVHIDTARPTNERVDLGTLTVGNALDLSLANNVMLELRLYGSFDDTGGLHDDWITLSSRGGLAGSLSGDTFTGTADYVAYGYRFTLSGSVTVDPATGGVTAYELVSHAASTTSDDLEHVEFSGGGLPLVQYEHGEDSVFYQAGVTFAETCDHVDDATRTTVYGGDSGSMTGYACEGPGGVASVRIRLSSGPLSVSPQAE